jgi:hypothetical protein
METGVHSDRERIAYAQLVVLGAAVLLAAGVVAALLLRNDGGGTTPRLTVGMPTLVTPAELKAFAKTLDQPIYWAGPRDGFSYELTATPGGRVFVRYLPQGVRAGDARPNFLTVGTYPTPNALGQLRAAARRPGAVSLQLDGGGHAVFAPKRSSSAYVAYPGSAFQVEVYAPTLEAARRVVANGLLKPIA